MAILLTGGTGKTSTRMIPEFQKASIQFLIATRKGPVGSVLPTTKFDWEDASTWENPFNYSFPNEEKITTAYLIPPDIVEFAPIVNSFIDLAVKQGVKRFVFVAGSSVVKGSPMQGEVWQHLSDIDVEYIILCPSWFNENFSEWGHLKTIRDEGKIYTSAGDARIAFVSVADIAAVAFHALTDDKIYGETIKIKGPELLTYNDVANKFSTVLGKEVSHIPQSPEERAKALMAGGIPEGVSQWLSIFESTSNEETLDGEVEPVTGKPAQSFSDWVKENKNAWN